MFVKNPLAQERKGPFAQEDIRRLDQFAASGRMQITDLLGAVQHAMEEIVYFPSCHPMIPPHERRSHFDLINWDRNEYVVPGYSALRWVMQRADQFRALQGFTSVEDFFMKLTEIEEFGGVLAVCVLRTPVLMDMVAPERRREVERELARHSYESDTEWMHQLVQYGWSIDEVFEFVQEIYQNHKRSQACLWFEPRTLNLFGVERSIKLLEQMVQHWAGSFLECRSMQQHLTELTGSEEAVKQLFKLACRYLKKVPDPDTDDMGGMDMLSFTGYIKLLRTFPLEDRVAAAMNVEINLSGIYFITDVLYALETSELMQEKILLLQRLLEIMNENTAAQVFRWVALFTQPADRRERNPLPDAWFYPELRQKLLSSGWDFAEVQVDTDGHGGEKFNPRTKECQLVAVTKTRCYNGKRIKWLHDRHNSEVRAGMKVIVPTSPREGHRQIFSSESICGYLVDLSEFTLAQRAIGLNKDYKGDTDVAVITQTYLDGRISHSYRMRYYRQDGLDYIEFWLLDRNGKIDSPVHHHWSETFDWLKQFFIDVKAAELGYKDTDISWIGDKDKWEQVNFRMEDLERLNGATIEVRKGKDRRNGEIDKFVVRGSSLNGRTYEGRFR